MGDFQTTIRIAGTTIVRTIAQIGASVCYIGMIFTLPLMVTIAAVAYTDCLEKINDTSAEAESAAKVRF